ncbi:MAG TPA: MIP/aquaporin family protein [Actinomycetota bacterium]|jgi:arsenate reductase|nr:MIP/aquaporin family protein [Actinomycetota bacterium]
MTDGLGRRLLAEFLGTAFLAAAVIGSGIMASRLSPNDAGLELLENATATAAALVAIILAIGPVSGAHLNPVVTLADRFFGGLGSGEAAGYIGAQFAGAAAGAAAANLMFSLPVVELSTTVRSSGGLWFAEVVATFGLLLVIFGVVRSGRASAAPFAVGAYIGGAYFFTASTSFANPAVTLARTLSHTFAGINPSSVPPFVAAQLVGAGLAILAIKVLYPTVGTFAADVVVPRETDPLAHRRGSGTWRGHHDRSRLYASPIGSPHSSVAPPESSGERPAKSKEAS